MPIIKTLVSYILLIFQLHAAAQDSSFSNRPWEHANYPVVIDPYQENNIDFNKLAADKRVMAIIHKASQGLKADARYVSRREMSISKNILYASYHLGTNTDPVQQADFYLRTMKHPLYVTLTSIKTYPV